MVAVNAWLDEGERLARRSETHAVPDKGFNATASLTAGDLPQRRQSLAAVTSPKRSHAAG